MDRQPELKRLRDEEFWRLVAYLNEVGDDRDHLFDCGALGVCLITWGRFGWEGRWWTLEKDPLADSPAH